MTDGGYGIPLICPKCPEEWAPRALKTPRIKVPKCSVCNTSMVPCDKSRRATWELHRKHARGTPD